jgi:DNA mismatch endonuclease (patch repair protein)
MSRIRKTNTKPEIIVRRFLFSSGFRYRVHVRKLIGNPDIVLSRYKIAIFINGCFWHAHKNCRLNRMPKSNVNYWIPKIEGNVERDKKNRINLRREGWKIIVVWECQLHLKKRKVTLQRLEQRINKIKENHEIY